MPQSQHGIASKIRKAALSGLLAVVATLFTLLLAELLTMWLYPTIRGNANTWADIYDRLHMINAETELAQGKRFYGKSVEVASLLHPYLGFAMDPQTQLQQRNGKWFHPYSDLGFFRSGTLPIGHNDDTFIVAISGGSVAGQFFNTGGNLALQRALESDPVLRRKKVKVLNYALAGFKQPQELMTLNYLLVLGGHFDLWISLNGFNDIVLPAFENEPNHVAMVYPRGWNLLTQSAVDPVEANLRSVLFTTTAQREHWRTIAARPLLERSALVRAWWDIIDRRLQEKARTLTEQVQARQMRSFDYGPVYLDRDGVGPEFLAQRSLEIWERSTQQMAKLCASNGTTYVVFVQPNQYFKDSKVLNEEEKRIAWAKDGYRPYAEIGYPLLAASAPKLRAEGISVVDLTMIFRDESRTVYSDTCCHLNDLGNEIMGQHMTEEIIRVLREKNSALTQ